MSKERNVDHIVNDVLITSLYSILVGLGISVVLGALAFFATPSVQASELDRVDKLPALEMGSVKRGSLRLKLASGGQSVDAPLLTTDVNMDVSGLSARVKVEQAFTNVSQGWAEGIYVFPLPENSAVDRMRLRIGDRIIEGEIKLKEEAIRTYKAAKKAGKKASLLRQERPNIFTTAVANIGPGEKVVVEIEYQQQLEYRQGQFRIRFPLVVGPRYIPGQVVGQREVENFSGNGWAQNTTAVPDASRISPPVVDQAENKINPVTIHVNLNAGLPLARLESSYHEIESMRDEQGIHRITMKQSHMPADRDFELLWIPKVGTAPHAALFTEQWEGAQYAMMMLMPPAPTSSGAARTPREVIYVIDTSGSMQGDSILQAKAALKMAIERLSPVDRFNLIQFNHQTHQLFTKAVAANTGNRQHAIRYVNSLRADGGTEMLPALEKALEGDAERGVLRQVVFLTDGSVGNETQLFEVIEKKLGESRLFTVGIGSAPNSFFMTRAAKFGRGSFTYVGKVTEVQEKMQLLFSKLETAALTDIKLNGLDDAQIETWPPKIPDLYEGEPIVLTMKFMQVPDAINLQGERGGTQWKQRVQLNGGGGQSPGIHLLWARNKIADLMEQESRGKPEAEVKKEVVSVALAHKLVSRYTSLVAVDKTPARPVNALLESKTLPTNLPTGWQQKGVFGQLPQTATPATLKLYIGAILVLLAMLLVWIRPRTSYIALLRLA